MAEYSRQRTLSEFLRRNAPEMTAAHDDVLTPSEYRNYNMATRAGSMGYWPVTALAMALRETGLLDYGKDVITGQKYRPNLEEIPGTQEYMQEWMGGDPYAPENLPIDLLSPDPFDWAHLIPALRAVNTLKNTNPERALELEQQLEQAKALLQRGDEPQAVSQRLPLIEPVPIGGRSEIFYRPPRDGDFWNATIEDIEAHPDLNNPGDVVELGLGDIYHYPALYEAVPGLENMPVKFEMQNPPSAGFRGVMQGGVVGGGYNPEFRSIEIPLYPPHDPVAETQTAPAMLAFVMSPFDDFGEFAATVAAEDTRFRNIGFPHGVAHEAAHGVQHSVGNPRGSNTFEIAAIREYDPDQLRDFEGDMFTLPQQFMYGFQGALGNADHVSRQVPGYAANQAFDDVMTSAMDEVREVWQNMLNDIPPGLSPEQQQHAERVVNLTYDNLLRAMVRTVDDVEDESLKALAALKRRFPDKTQDELEEYWQKIFPDVKAVAINRNILRVSDDTEGYLRHWGEAEANAAGENVVNERGLAGEAAIRQMSELGQVYDPSILTVRKYWDDYTQELTHPAETGPADIQTAAKPDWDEIVRSRIDG